MNYFITNIINDNRMANFLLKVALLLGVAIYMIDALQLEGLSTKKPRTTKYSSKAAAATSSPSTTSIYRVNNTKGTTCILIRTDGILDITYRTVTGEDVVANTFLPDDVDLSGDCSDEDISNMVMKFKGFVLFMEFKKTPGGERWYVSNVELTYSSSNPLLKQVDRPNLQVKLSTPPHNTLLFPTPVGKSYTCDEQDIILYSRDENDRAGHTAKLNLRELRMQCFMYKATNAWGVPFQCSATGTYRDETAPMFVGTFLAIMALGSVSAYGVWRYFKIKKVQYGTME